MSTPNSKIAPPYKNFREAFCGKYGCKPERYESTVFWKTLHRHAVLPALLFGGVNAEFFHNDRDTIRNLGDATHAGDLQQVMDEFSSLNSIDRDLARQFFRLRISGTRIAALFSNLLPSIQPPSATSAASSPRPRPDRRPTPATPAPSTPADVDDAEILITDPKVVEPAVGTGMRESNVLAIRKLRRIHEQIISGQPLESVLAEAALSHDELLRALASPAAARPELAWLRTYLLERAELIELRLAHARLKEFVATLTVQRNEPK